MYKGIEKNQNYTWLICCAQNMKNIVTKITNTKKKPGDTPPSSPISSKNIILNLTITFLRKIFENPRIFFWGLSTV